MPRYLILKLDGPMQAWGGHTFEDFRPSHLFPTRSGLLGLIGACMGIDRQDAAVLATLAESLEFTVRADQLPGRTPLKLLDFHTVQAARKVDGSVNKNPVVSRREYLFDAAFTVALGERSGGAVNLDTVAAAIKRPRYTPTLGRRSCPLSRPLYEGWAEADDAKAALRQLSGGGVIYAEGEALANNRPLQIRDVPMHTRKRQFGTRQVYVHAEGGEG
ncbi:MAG: type I-E CRISPR-associated protein Cas5/CasD [Pseudomonadota bacterium]|nr:type I-E CRISPR-associated protein Cas5/CasD [Pseudomonadota bacterium]MDP2351326.1 type I-E CRISPR-associated protein Cas5/CasD [Pseudomonadota bacterium]